MEILAPAGSREALERAQAAGADAVYLGYAAFSARAGAGNFNEEQLKEALRFAHLHHMRVYVTVNTLVKDQELPEVIALLRLLNRLRADGVLVQDLGILRLARKLFPGLRIHASTQMAVHNETGVRWCAKMGMKRVVLARECSLEEIRRCVRTGMEIEVFGHGAQCVSVSGECLFSSMVGERSGNRGRCAQPCRKIYSLDGRKGAWLSPRDLCLRDRIPDLAEAGAASLKMEGRLKRPEYVYTVTRSYRRGMDLAEEGCFRRADPAERESLMQAFHRGGFMEGYAFGAEDAGLIQPHSVNHQGIRIGEVAEVRGDMARIRLEKDLRDGDGLRIRCGRREGETSYAGPETAAGGTALLRLRPGLRAEAGDEVFRLTDARQISEAMAAPLRKIPVRMELEAWPGREIRLRVSDGESGAEVTGDTVSPARNRETAPEEMEKQLRKTGGTDFEAAEIRISTGGAFVPVSVLNELRRAALERLAESRIDRFAYPEGPETGAEGPEKGTECPEAGGRAERQVETDFEPRMLVTVRNREQAEACRGENVRLIWYPEDFRKEPLENLMAQIRPGDWLRLPEVCEEETLREILLQTEKYRDRLGGVLLGSVGQLGISWPVPVAAGPGVPVMNREAARLLGEQGCRFVTASPELSGEEGKELRIPEKGLPEIVFPVYGRTQLMLLHHCPARTAQGWSQGHGACRLCEEEDPRALRGKALEDERGYRFPMLRVRLPEGCLVRLLNTLPTDLGGKRIPAPLLAEMTVETGEQAAMVMDHLLRNEKTPGESTRGHWNRPVL